jgi:gliding motility-associated protein GldM
MAGGKETPRQKMIGMMYLVLTALLALNVSKSILDAFVAIEENTQKSNIVQYDRGSGFYNDVKSELSSSKGEENKAKREKLEYVINQMNLIDKESSKMIESIDKLKKKILEKSGEDVSGFKSKDGSTILWSEYDKNNASLPTRMNLMAVQSKDQYDVPMNILIGDDIKNPTGEGIKLWEDFNKYRNKVVELTGTYKWGGKQFTVKPVNIPQFTSNADLSNKVTKMIDQSKGNLKEDKQVLVDLYMGMTKLEKATVHEVENVHWIGATFDHAPLVAAIASLTSMQQDVLAARALSLAHWKSKVSTGEYSFNKIMPLAYGPEVANSNEEIELQVMMAAFDSDNQPVVTVDGYDNQDMVSYSGNGQGDVKVNVTGSGEMKITGTVSIKNKSGVTKTEPWEKTVVIMKPQGSIEMPEFNVLYRGYKNKVTATASGYDKTILSASGARISGSGPYVVTTTGRSSVAYLTVSGKNTATGKTASLKKVKYRVQNLPDPTLFWGSAKSGKKASKSSRTLIARYDGIPLDARFRIVSWTCYAPGLKGAPPKGSGSSLSSANGLLRILKPGTGVSFNVKVVGPDGVIRQIGGAWTI